MAPSDPPLTDPRRAAILAAAFETLCRFGYRRTTMEDIARASGLSRASLYLHFSNKQDISRSLMQTAILATEERVRAALKPGFAPEAALIALFAAKAGPEIQAIFASPHAEELLDASFGSHPDIVAEGEQRIAAHLAAWLRAEAAAGRVRIPAGDTPADLAVTLITADHGLKRPAAGLDAYRAASGRLARLAGRGLRA